MISSSSSGDDHTSVAQNDDEEDEEEVCVVGSVEYYSNFCLDWRGEPVKEIGGGPEEGGEKIEWKPNENTTVLYPNTSID